MVLCYDSPSILTNQHCYLFCERKKDVFPNLNFKIRNKPEGNVEETQLNLDILFSLV